MSVSRTLDRFLSEVRREAKRNPAFAERLDAVFRAHASGRDVPEALIEEVAAASSPDSAAEPHAPALNPHAVFAKTGEDGLRTALAGLDAAGLASVIAEHNLDPAGKAKDADAAALRDQIIAAAARRAERDKKLFDY